MKPQKDIFDLIKDNQHKLNERPSDQAWRKLEQRLSHKAQRRSISLFRSMSWAAAVVAIAVMAVVISLVFTKTADHNLKVAMADKEPLPMILEELPTYSDLSDEAARMEAFRRKYENRLANPIAEGSGNKRLVAQPVSSNDQLNDEVPSDSANVGRTSSRELAN